VYFILVTVAVVGFAMRCPLPSSPEFLGQKKLSGDDAREGKVVCTVNRNPLGAQQTRGLRLPLRGRRA
jgi:hypothetical protein